MKTISITVLSSGLVNEIMAEKVMGYRTDSKNFGLLTVLIITMDSGCEYVITESAESFRERLANILDSDGSER